MTQILDQNKREQDITLLVLNTGWNRAIFEKMTPEELERHYRERVERE